MVRLKPAWILALAASLLAVPPVPTAQAQRGRARKSAPKIDFDKIKADLQSGDEQRIASALDTVAGAGEAGQAAVPAIEALLRRGTSAKLLVRTMRVAAQLKQSTTSLALAPYIRHRDPGLRRAAAEALVNTRGAAAVDALRSGLRSGDGVVRGVCASGLGELKAREAMDDLFAALEHNVPEAAGSIGRMCRPDECEKFKGYVGKQPLEVMTLGFDEMLFRPTTEVSEDEKIRLVGLLREVGTREAGNFLAGVGERWPKDWSRKLRTLIDAAARATGGKTEE